MFSAYGLSNQANALISCTVSFPAGSMPGINYKHIAFSNPGSHLAGGTGAVAASLSPTSILRFSGIAQGNSFTPLHYIRSAGAAQSGCQAVYHSILGPCVNFPTASSRIVFGGQGTVLDATCTMAVMFMLLPSAPAQGFLYGQSAPGTTGWGVNVGTASPYPLRMACGSTSFNSLQFANLIAQFNVPYFFVCSAQNNVQNGLLMNLMTGGIVTQSIGTALTYTAPISGQIFINDDASTQGTIGWIAAAAQIANYLTIEQMMVWANDPWAFWYPNWINNVNSRIGGPALQGYMPLLFT